MGAKDDLPPVEEKSGLDDDRTQRGMEVDTSRYYETGRATMGRGADGLPVMQGPPPAGPGPGLTEDGLICNKSQGRTACRYYAAVLLPADGVTRGFDQPKQIRRFCTRLQTASELFEITDDVYACTLRDPPDPQSAKLIDDFEAKQRAITEETQQKSATLDL